jgi:hypothetical protein
MVNMLTAATTRIPIATNFTLDPPEKMLRAKRCRFRCRTLILHVNLEHGDPGWSRPLGPTPIDNNVWRRLVAKYAAHMDVAPGIRRGLGWRRQFAPCTLRSVAGLCVAAPELAPSERCPRNSPERWAPTVWCSTRTPRLVRRHDLRRRST